MLCTSAGRVPFRRSSGFSTHVLTTTSLKAVILSDPGDTQILFSTFWIAQLLSVLRTMVDDPVKLRGVIKSWDDL
jgi:hypothetical protein